MAISSNLEVDFSIILLDFLEQVWVVLLIMLSMSILSDILELLWVELSVTILAHHWWVVLSMSISAEHLWVELSMTILS
eukprot:UN09870